MRDINKFYFSCNLRIFETTKDNSLNWWVCIILLPSLFKLNISLSNRGVFRTQSNIYYGAFFTKVIKGFWPLPIFRSSRPEVFCKKGVLRNFATLLKKRLWYRCFPVNFAKFLTTPILHNTSGRLLYFHRCLTELQIIFWVIFGKDSLKFISGCFSWFVWAYLYHFQYLFRTSYFRKIWHILVLFNDGFLYFVIRFIYIFQMHIFIRRFIY